jgi:hypothetical protein
MTDRMKGADFRAVFWINAGEEVLLTTAEHAEYTDEELLAEAVRYADAIGIDLSQGEYEIVEAD